MDTQYVDMYLRKKRNILQEDNQRHGSEMTHSTGSMPNTTAAPVPASHVPQKQHHGTFVVSPGTNGTVDKQVDTVLRSTYGVQQFVDRTDSLAIKVDNFEDKIINLTRLLKLSQTLQDEKETDLRKQNHELKSRLKRQEQLTYRLEKEIDSIKSRMHKTAAVEDEVRNLSVSLKELRSSRDHGLLSRVEATEQRCSGIDDALREFMSAYKDSARSIASQHAEVAHTLKDVAESHETTRQTLMTELQGIKEWATRNLTRLKKHVDMLHSDLTALQESHVETSTQLMKVQNQTENEHEKLLALLQQKSREANLLTDIVDKEIQSINTITQQHRAGLGQKIAFDSSDTKGTGAIGSPSKNGACPVHGVRKNRFSDISFN
eukprot:Tbor_TRINITY_DN1193_c0_g1::TRINITY_DN1193_c0_g1_i1::g.15575::m.15575